MRMQFVSREEVVGIVSAQLECPWATIVVAVEGGYLAFESEADYEQWNNQAGPRLSPAKMRAYQEWLGLWREWEHDRAQG